MIEIEAIVRQLALPMAGKSLLSTITNHNTIRQHTNRIQKNHEENLNANEKILLLESENTFLKRENAQLKRRISQLEDTMISEQILKFVKSTKNKKWQYCQDSMHFTAYHLKTPGLKMH